MKVAIIGLGNISKNHFQAISSLDGVSLVGICDLDHQKRASFPLSIPFFKDYKDMILKVNPDCVHICLPHFLHYEVARECAALGVNIFTEKPFSLNYRQGLDFLKLEEKYNVKIGICFQSRYNFTTIKLKQLLDSGDYGNIIGINAVLNWNRDQLYYSSSPWRGQLATAGGGLLINQGIHTIDLIRYFIGEPCLRVNGKIGNIQHFKNVDVEDFAVFNLFFSNNIKVLFTGSLANFKDEGVEINVACENALFKIKGNRLFLLDASGEHLIAENEENTVGKACYGSSHKLIIKDFYDAILNETYYVNAKDTIENLKIIDAVRQSSLENKIIEL